MGLVNLANLKHADSIAEYYFNDARWNGNGYSFEWPSKNFPYMAAIHHDAFNDNPGLRLFIRKWADSCMNETIIIHTKDMTYFDYTYKCQIPNYWTTFSFDREESLLVFKLKFSDYVSEITNKHPTKFK
jgi:hypothetical protein